MMPIALLLLAAAEPTPRPELAWLPPSAVFAAQVDIPHWWNSDLTASYRDILVKAGEPAAKAFFSRYPVVPPSVIRVTLVGVTDGGEVPFAVIARTANPIDAKKLAELFRKPKSDQPVMAYKILDDNTFAISEVPAVLEKLPSKPVAKLEGVAAELARLDEPLALAIDFTLKPPTPDPSEVPEALRPLATVKAGTLTARYDGGIRYQVAMRFADAAQTEAGEKAAHAAIAEGRQLLKKQIAEAEARLAAEPDPRQPPFNAVNDFVGLIGLRTADEYLAAMPLRRDGLLVRTSGHVPLPQSLASSPMVPAIGVGLLLPAVQKVREAAHRAEGANNLKRLALAAHIHHDKQKQLPAHAIYSADGKPLLSWRVRLLPYLEEENLSKRFRLDEPWDSDHNKKFIPLMPKVYALPSDEARAEGKTYYQAVVGDDTIWPRRPVGLWLNRITDGTSNTVLFVEAATPVIWTKPDDVVYDAAKPLPKFGRNPALPFTVAFADGSVRSIPRTMPEPAVRAILTAAGGEVIDLNQ